MRLVPKSGSAVTVQVHHILLEMNPRNLRPVIQLIINREILRQFIHLNLVSKMTCDPQRYIELQICHSNTSNPDTFEVADPGLFRGGSANRKGVVPTYYFGQFPPKLDGNEKNWTRRRGRVPGKLSSPHDPPEDFKQIVQHNFTI